MSPDNVEAVRGLVEDFNRRDLPAMAERFDPEIEWAPGGPAAVERAVYRGRDEVCDAFAATWETWERFELEESEIRDLDNPVLWLGRSQLRGGASQVELDQEFAILVSLQNDKIVRLQGFTSWQGALEAAGLRD